MTELLIELFCEEIPALMQLKAESAYLSIFTKYFKKVNVTYKKIEVFTGPRRITVFVNGINKEIEEKVISFKGPRISDSSNAINGFCKSNGTNKNNLIIKEVKGIEYYFYERRIVKKPTRLVFLETLTSPILEYIWPKSMYWSNHKIKWVRPLKNVLCVFDRETIPIQVGHLTANNITLGHKFMHPKEIIVRDFYQYKKDLESSYVILDRNERKNRINFEIQEILAELNKKNNFLYLKKDNQLLFQEILGLIEYPVVLCGKIDKKFLDLPKEVLISSMEIHQKYFCLLKQVKYLIKGKERNKESFAPFFLFVSNIKPANCQSLIRGNEQVLLARLSDALYFYQQDLKRKLNDSISKLDKIVFHRRLGSLKQKTKRLVKLSRYIGPQSQLKELEEAALLCKSDLVSEMVNEFPELQGIIGYYYAIVEGKKEKVAIAIRDHYKPQGPLDSVPVDYNCSDNIAPVLALADKIDSLCGLMLAGEAPSGSKDPHSLRRLAIGIIRIILTNKFEHNLCKLIDYSCSLYSKLIKYDSEQTSKIITFIEDRAKNYFKDKFNLFVVNAIVNCRLEPSLYIIKLRLEALTNFLVTHEGRNLLNCYKRVTNIINSNRKLIMEPININLFSQREEKELLDVFQLVALKLDYFIEKKMFLESLKELTKLNDLVSNFFENVVILDKDPKIRNNRFLLLKKVRDLFNKVGIFNYC